MTIKWHEYYKLSLRPYLKDYGLHNDFVWLGIKVYFVTVVIDELSRAHTHYEIVH